MINKSKAQWFCKDDISLIENYELAINDKTQTWHCHHRRETIYTRNDLIEIGEYYKRPAIELIFLTRKEHYQLHQIGNKNMLGKKHSNEARQKMSESLKGHTPWNKGKKFSVESRKKMSESHKGKSPTNKGIKTGKSWWTNGNENILAKECPDGFVKGRICKRKSL